MPVVTHALVVATEAVHVVWSHCFPLSQVGNIGVGEALATQALDLLSHEKFPNELQSNVALHDCDVACLVH